MNVFAAMNAIEIEKNAKWVWCLFQCMILVGTYYDKLTFNDIVEWSIYTNHCCIPIKISQIADKEYIKNFTTYDEYHKHEQNESTP